MTLKTIQIGLSPQTALVGADEVDGKDFQVAKMSHGAEGEIALVSEENPLPTADLGAAYQLSTTPSVQIRKGRYQWAVQASNFNGATVRLKALGPDGLNYFVVRNLAGDPAELTSTGVLPVDVGRGAILVLEIVGGSPVALASSLT